MVIFAEPFLSPGNPPMPTAVRPPLRLAACLLLTVIGITGGGTSGRIMAADSAAKPLEVLYITGGCCHD